MSQNTFNNNNTPYNQQAPYGQPQNGQQAFNQNMTYNQQQAYGQQPQQPYNRPQQNAPMPPSGNNNKNMIIIGAIAAGVVIIGLIIALVVVLNKKGDEPSTETARNTTEAVTEERTTEEVTTEAATEATTEAATEATTEATTETATEATTEAADNPAPAPAATVDGLSDDLYSEQIAIDGKVYHLPFDYALISDEWTFDMADYGHAEGYVMNPEDKVTSTISLENPKFDEDLDYYVGFVNAGTEAKDIKETSVYSVDIDITWTDTNNYPSVVLPKGITWGATLDEVKAAYGEPADSYYSDSLQYWSYTYKDDDYDYSVELQIYDDRGVTEIDVSSYKND